MSNTDMELAQFLTETDGVTDDEQQITINTIRRCCPELRKCLMDNPAVIDEALAAMLMKRRNDANMTMVINNQSVAFMESLMEPSSDEE